MTDLAPSLLQHSVALLTRLGQAVNQALQCAAQRRRLHADLQALREMDSRALRDLGIGRDEIPYWISRR